MYCESWITRRTSERANGMTAAQDTRDIQTDLERRGVSVTFDDAQTLRRAAWTLHRWAELECGDGNDHASWAIERDEDSGVPYFVTYPYRGDTYRRKIADRERGALRRIADVCERYGLHYFHQGDPRGAALYVHTEPLQDTDYTRGVAI